MGRLLLTISLIKTIVIPITAFLIPLILVTGVGTKEAKCAYVVLVMAILWLTEAIPIPATALMPVFLLPMLGIQSAKDVSAAYISDTTMLFLGGLILAVAVEEWNLHRRIALSILRISGSQPNILMLGLMLPTWFLSMWISNTAATAMMVPIIQAVVKQMQEVHTMNIDDEGEHNLAFETDSGRHRNLSVEHIEISSMSTASSRERVEIRVSGYPGDTPTGSQLTILPSVPSSLENARAEVKHLNRIAKGFCLSVAYAANMGGVATLTGTPPNLVLQDRIKETYEEYGGNGDNVVTFANWMGFAFPMSLLGLAVCWGWLQLVFLRCSCCRKPDMKKRYAVKAAIIKEFKALGKMTFAEIEVLVVFCLLVILWLFRSAPNIGGWGELFVNSKTGTQYVSDSTGAIFISVLLFMLPSRKPTIFCWGDLPTKPPKYIPLVSWKAVEKKVPWGVIILLGGGFAIANASKESGLSTAVGNALKGLADQEVWAMNLVLSITVAAATEVTSNTATATLLMPILASLAISINVHPLYLMISGAVACSFAFMLPVATPPNAIVFSTGYLSIPDMALAGLPMNFLAVLVLTIAINSWGIAIFGLQTMPDLFKKSLTQPTVNPCNITR